MSDYSLEKHNLAANTIRGLAMDGVQAANSGHPGMPMGMADVATVLWSQFLKHNPADPTWPDRDRFVLSAGHGSMLLYSLLHLSGYDLPLDELKHFRQWGSKTPGHPEYGHTVGVETTTGPLGQGITVAAGMALAERWLAARFNRPDFEIVDHYTYVIASDGDLMEGISHESSSLAGHLGLGKLIVFYDDNEISIDGSTDISFTEDVMARYAAYGWHTQSIDGHDPLAIIAATEAAQAETERPSIIACHTTIGFGSPNQAGTSGVHGSPLGEEEVRLTKLNLGIPLEPTFFVPAGVKAFMAGDSGAQEEWQALWREYQEALPDLAVAFDDGLAGKIPTNWDDILPTFEPPKKIATRNASGQVLNAIARHMPNLIGGSADLTPSNKTDLKGEEDIQKGNYDGRYIRFGVREHAMGGMLNGLAQHGGIRPYGGTFLIFSDYMRGSIRLAALSGAPVIYVFTHDSIGVGEDGPTHQPVEQVMSLRTIPNLTVIRPADATETAVAWRCAIENTTGPTALILTRQNLITNNKSSADAARGGYILHDHPNPKAILIASGSEVEIMEKAAAQLGFEGILARVVSMPSWELFAAQSQAYRDSVLPPHLTARVSLEAGVTLGWERYVGSQGIAIGIDHFGASAPYATVYKEFGLTAEAVAAAVHLLLD
ncbi:MAG: transketolase [Anaerolineales bacterium]|nr:transketolase [Anaerolineales bacterium]